MSFDENFAKLGLELPPAPKAIGLYKPLIIEGSLCYLSGHGPLQANGQLITGKIGKDIDDAAGHNAAKQTGLAMIATLKANFGSLDRIDRLVKTFGMVNCTDDYTAQPAVINGFSQLMADVFGEELGIAARSAIGVSSLPAGMAVEVEAIFKLKD